MEGISPIPLPGLIPAAGKPTIRRRNRTIRWRFPTNFLNQETLHENCHHRRNRFIGSVILREALQRGHQVSAIVRHPEKLPEHPALTALKGDITIETKPQRCWRGRRP